MDVPLPDAVDGDPFASRSTSDEKMSIRGTGCEVELTVSGQHRASTMRGGVACVLTISAVHGVKQLWTHSKEL